MHQVRIEWVLYHFKLVLAHVEWSFTIVCSGLDFHMLCYRSIIPISIPLYAMLFQYSRYLRFCLNQIRALVFLTN